MSIGVDVLWILQNMFLLTVYITAYSFSTAMLVFQRVIGFEPSSRVKIAFGNSEHAAEECVYNLICLPRVSPVGEP
jgi:hypothetical protein